MCGGRFRNKKVIGKAFVRLAKPKGSDEVEQLPGSGRLPYGSRCHRRRSPSSSWTALKDRAAASVFKARSPHRSSCRRRACNERRPSTEIRLGVDSALGACETSPTFSVLRLAFASERAPPETCREESVHTASAFDVWCLYR